MKKISFFLLLSCYVLFSNCSSTKATVANMLTGNSWMLNTLMGQQPDASSFGKGLPTLNFTSDGKLTGSTGCNNFTGSFKVTGTSISLDPGAMTKMACNGNGETNFLNTLKQVNSFKMNDNTLSLLDGASEIMSFVPAK